MVVGSFRKKPPRAFGLDPEIIFYDEPTAGLDPVGTAIIDNLDKSSANFNEFSSDIKRHPWKLLKKN